MILSPDGHCRVVRRRAPRHRLRPRCGHGAAEADWRRPCGTATDIYAVIKGSAVNNDGSLKARVHGAERDRPGGSDRRGVANAGSGARDDRLCGGARHRHQAGRPDRDRGADPGVSAGYPRRPATAPSDRSRPISAIWMSAAGIAGLIKTALCWTAVGAASLHFRSPQPGDRLCRESVLRQRSLRPWPAAKSRAGRV